MQSIFSLLLFFKAKVSSLQIIGKIAKYLPPLNFKNMSQKLAPVCAKPG